MGTKYTTNGDTGYNSGAPPDDGTTGANNLVTWAKHKENLTDPILDYVDDINTDLVAWADNTPNSKASAYTTVASDNNKIIECTSTFNLTLGAAATMGAGYRVTAKNAGAGVITVKTGDTIDGSASDRTLNPLDSETYVVDNAGGDYHIESDKSFALLDEDAMTSNSAISAASQQSIKYYVDNVPPRWRYIDTLDLSSTLNYDTIPAGATMFRVTFKDTDTNAGATTFGIQLGGTTYPVAGVSAVNSTSGSTAEEDTSGVFILARSGIFSASQDYQGSITFTREDATNHVWFGKGITRADSGSYGGHVSDGLVTLPAELDRFKFVVTGAAGFDAGTAHFWAYY